MAAGAWTFTNTSPLPDLPDLAVITEPVGLTVTTSHVGIEVIE